MVDASSKNKNSAKNLTKDKSKDGLAKKRREISRFLPERAYRLLDPKVKMWALLVTVSLFTAFLLAPRSFQVYSLTIDIHPPCSQFVEEVRGTVIAPGGAWNSVSGDLQKAER